jgi:hypothetical protein
MTYAQNLQCRRAGLTPKGEPIPGAKSAARLAKIARRNVRRAQRKALAAAVEAQRAERRIAA